MNCNMTGRAKEHLEGLRATVQEPMSLRVERAVQWDACAKLFSDNRYHNN